MGSRIDQHQRAQAARNSKRQGDQRLLQTQLHMADGIGWQLGRIHFLQGVDVQSMQDADYLGLDPAVTV